MIITIDGPVASGKSTIARLLAQRLGFYYINSGLLFRAIAYIVSEKCNHDESSLEKLKDGDLVDLLKKHSIVYRYHESAQIFIDGVDVTLQLKSAAIDRAASLISTRELIRERVLHEQHEIARDHDCIVEGRDAGTIVFPHADVHIFLTAPVAVRAERWQKDQSVKGNIVSIDQAKLAVVERDERDSSRASAPLRVPDGAYIIDSGVRTISEVVAELSILIDAKR